MEILSKKKSCFFLGSFMALVFSVFIFFQWNLYLLQRSDRLEWKRLRGFVECSLQHESNPMQTELTDFKRLYEYLNQYHYMEIYGQPLDFLENGKEHFDAYADQWTKTAERVKAVQISPNVLEEFQLTVAQGRSWEEKELLLENQGQKLPVILGAGYSGIYETGDTFEAEYLYDPYEFTVIGFLNPGSTIYTGRGGLINLDSAILLPSFCVTEEYPVTDGLKIHYANKTSGYIKLDPETYLEEYQRIKELANTAGAGEYSFNLSPFSAFFRNRFGFPLMAAFVIVAIGSVVCGAGILWLLHKVRLKYGRSAKYSAWIFFLPFVIHLCWGLAFWNSVRILWDLGTFLLAVSVILILHFLGEALLHKK